MMWPFSIWTFGCCVLSQLGFYQTFCRGVSAAADSTHFHAVAVVSVVSEPLAPKAAQGLGLVQHRALCAEDPDFDIYGDGTYKGDKDLLS